MITFIISIPSVKQQKEHVTVKAISIITLEHLKYVALTQGKKL